jgi:uncharacterized C2H2 Zn-finger protein
MATETRVLIDTWCDTCLMRDDQRVEATWSETISFGRLTRHFDLCGSCRDKLIGELPEMLERYGTKSMPGEQRRAMSGDGMQCPKCGGEFDSRQSLASHVRGSHGKTMTALEIELGLPQTGEDLVACPVCGKQYMGTVGVATHARKAHPGVDVLSRVKAK